MRVDLPRLTISGLMTVVALLGVGLAISRDAPGVVVLAAVVSGLAMVRTGEAVARASARGVRVNGETVMVLFVASLVVVTLILVVTLLVFLVAFALASRLCLALIPVDTPVVFWQLARDAIPAVAATAAVAWTLYTQRLYPWPWRYEIIGKPERTPEPPGRSISRRAFAGRLGRGK